MSYDAFLRLFLFQQSEGLRNYFSEFGKVDACTIVRDADGKSRGFAFLTFDDPESVNAVMIREYFLGGEPVRVILCRVSLSLIPFHTQIDPKRAILRGFVPCLLRLSYYVHRVLQCPCLSVCPFCFRNRESD